MHNQARVLLLEDDSTDATLIAHELARAGLEITTDRVVSEEEFRRQLQFSTFDVILSDNGLPGLDAFSALKIARELAPEVPFIFVSDSPGQERAMQALREGASDFVSTDRMARLPTAIMRALAERQEQSLRRAAEEAARFALQRFECAANATSDVIWDWHLETNRVWIAAGLQDLLGEPRKTEREEKAGSWWCASIHPDDAERVKASLDSAISRREPQWGADYRLLRLDGSMVDVADKARVIFDPRGQPVRIIGALGGLTERNRLQQQLEQERRMSGLGRVAATITHEINNVLMGINALAETIQRLARNDERVTTITSQILNSVRRGKRVTDEILRFTKPADPVLRVIEMRDWLRLLVPELRAVTGERVEIDLDLPAESLWVLADGVQLQQVLTNLVVNARDAMAGSGSISLALSTETNGLESRITNPHARYLRLTVRDTGSGIPPDILDSIFEPLFTTKPSGTGLGLSVANQIAAAHGGSIFAENLPDAGAAFNVLIPMAGGGTAADPVRT